MCTGAERRPMIFRSRQIVLRSVKSSHPIRQRGRFCFHFSHRHFARYAMPVAILHVLAKALGNGSIRRSDQTVFHLHTRSLEQNVRAHHIIFVFESVSRRPARRPYPVEQRPVFCRSVRHRCRDPAANRDQEHRSRAARNRCRSSARRRHLLCGSGEARSRPKPTKSRPTSLSEIRGMLSLSQSITPGGEDFCATASNATSLPCCGTCGKLNASWAATGIRPVDCGHFEAVLYGRIGQAKRLLRREHTGEE